MRCLYLSFINRVSCALIVSFLLLDCISLSAQTPVVFFNPVITSGLTNPLDIVSANDGTNRMFIVERGGAIKILQNGVLLGGTFLNISSIITAGGERGLLSMAFHPAYSTNGYFFVYYTATTGDVTVARYRVSTTDPNLADASSGQVLISIFHREFANHNGGKLNFGIDGNLYFAVGDGGSGGDPHFYAQTGNVLLGKMIRINVDNFTTAPYYTVPADNPYVSDPAVADEIWATGLRNPFRWSFDRATHDMWIGDVGQDAWEEVDFRAAGSTGGVNYGWRCREGTNIFNDSGCNTPASYVPPIFEYDHSASGGISITGGMVYRGTDYPSLFGWYICVDYVRGNGWLIQPNGSGGWNIKAQTGLPAQVAGFGENESGELFAVGLNGRVYRVQVSSVLPVKLKSFTVINKSNKHVLNWTTASEQGASLFEIQYSSNGSGFQTIDSVPATNTNRSTTYQFSHDIPAGEKAFYRLKIIEGSSAVTFSSILKMELSDDQSVQITPTLLRNQQLVIKLATAFNSLQVMDINGQTVKKKTLGGSTGTIYVDMSGLAKGIYIIRLTGNNKEVYRRIAVQ